MLFNDARELRNICQIAVTDKISFFCIRHSLQNPLLQKKTTKVVLASSFQLTLLLARHRVSTKRHSRICLTSLGAYDDTNVHAVSTMPLPGVQYISITFIYLNALMDLQIFSILVSSLLSPPFLKGRDLRHGVEY